MTALFGFGIKAIGKGIQAFFGYKDRKEARKAIESTDNKEIQLGWWKFLISQDSPLNKILRPLTAAYFLGDCIYQLLFTGTYKIVTIVPQFTMGDYTIGPITNGLIVAFIIIVMFPWRGVEKMILRKS